MSSSMSCVLKLRRIVEVLHCFVSELTKSHLLLPVTTQGVHGHGTSLNRVDDDVLEIALLHARGPWRTQLTRRLFLGGNRKQESQEGFGVTKTLSLRVFPEIEKGCRRLSHSRPKMDGEFIAPPKKGEKGGDRFLKMRTDQTGCVAQARVPHAEPP